MRNRKLKGDPCTKCDGTGAEIANFGGFYGQVDCQKCAGTGLVNSPNACKKCKGSGSTIVNADGFNVRVDCPDCSGSGLKPIEK